MKSEYANTNAGWCEIFDNIMVGVFRVDLNNHVYYANKALCNMCGKSMEQVLGGEWLYTIHADDLEMVTSKWTEAMQSKQPLKINANRMVKPDGSVIWVSTSAQLERNQGGEVIGYLGTVTDITEQKQYEINKSNTYKEYKDLVEFAKVIILNMDKTGRVTYANPYAVNLFGFKKEEIEGKFITDTIVPEFDSEGKDLRAMVKSALDDPELFGDSVNENVCKDGKRKVISWSNKPRYSTNGEFEFLLCIGHDITELREREIEAQNLRDIANSSSDFIGIADINGKPKYLNQSGRAMVGVKDDEHLFSTLIVDYLGHEEKERLQNEIMPCVLKNGRYRGDFLFQNLITKEKIPVYFDLFRIDDPKTTVPVGVATVSKNMTAEIATKQLISRQAEELKRAQRIAKLGSWIFDLVKSESIWSDEMYQIIEVEKRGHVPVAGLSEEFVHNDDLERVRKIVEEEWYQGNAKPFEFKAVTAKGNIKFIAAQGEVEKNAHGEVVRMIGTIQDITELELERRKNKLVLEQALDAVVIIDGHTKAIEFFNIQAEKMFGFHQEEVMGKNVKIIVPLDHRAKHDAYIDANINTGKNKVIGIGRDLKMIRKNGEEFWGNLSLCRIGHNGTTKYTAFIKDITEQVLRRQKLESTSKALKEAQRIGKMGSWELDLENSKLKWSEGIYLILGLEPFSVQPTYETFLEFVHPEDREITNRVYSEHIEKKTNYDYVHRFLLKDGSIKYIRERGETKWDDKGKPLYTLGTAVDITDQKLAKIELEKYKDHLEEVVLQRTKELRETNTQLREIRNTLEVAYRNSLESEKKYRFLAENSLDVVASYDSQLNCIYMSPAIERITGFTSSQVQNMTLEEQIHSGDLQEVLKIYKRATTKRSKNQLLRYRRKRKEGGYVWVEAAVSFNYNTENQLAGIVLGIRDISEIKAAEEKLLKAKEYNRLLFDKNKIGLTLKTKDGEFKDVNEAFAEIIGYPVHDVLRLDYAKITPLSYSKEESRQLETLNKKRVYGPYDKEYIHKNGSLVPVRIQGRMIERDGEELILSSVEDISDKIIAQKKLEVAKQQLIMSDKMASLGILAAGIAHEINNPLNFVSAGLDSLDENLNMVLNLLQEYLELDVNNTFSKLPEIEKIKNEVEIDKLVAYLIRSQHNIRNGVERTKEIIRSMKSFTSTDKSKKNKADIHLLLDDTLLLLRNQYKENITIERKYAKIDPLLCFSGQLSQAFTNVIHNAIQAIEGKGFIVVSTQLLKKNNKGYVVVEIKDNGSGISNDNLKKIYDPFFTTKDTGKGTGLGLTITHSIVENHNGFIEVKSEVGTGTTVSMYLPIN